MWFETTCLNSIALFSTPNCCWSPLLISLQCYALYLPLPKMHLNSFEFFSLFLFAIVVVWNVVMAIWKLISLLLLLLLLLLLWCMMADVVVVVIVGVFAKSCHCCYYMLLAYYLQCISMLLLQLLPFCMVDTCCCCCFWLFLSKIWLSIGEATSQASSQRNIQPASKPFSLR